MPFTQETELSSASRRVGVYGDRGAGSTSFRQTWSMWKEAFPQDEIERIKRGDLETFLERGDLLIMPGGRDIFYHESIGESGSAVIRDFVERGGTYVGICAGAYFACSYIDFYATEQMSVRGRRHLRFWNGCCLGPIYRSCEYRIDTEKSASLVEISCVPSAKTDKVYYFGGGTFISSQESDYSDYCDYQVLSYYKSPLDESALERINATGAKQTRFIAALQKRVAKGKVYLFGYHPEFRSKHLSTKFHEKELVVAMQKEIDPKSVDAFRRYFI